MSLPDELQKLEELRRAGTLTDAEYEAAKAALIAKSGELHGDQAPPPPPPFTPPVAAATPAPVDPARRQKEARDWATWLHLSIFAGFVVPWGGFVLPIVLWQMKKEEFPEIDIHGKMIANWLISKHIYGAIGGLLMLFFCVGLVLLIPLGIASIAFPIIAAIKAGKGEVWSYPGAIPFFR